MLSIVSCIIFFDCKNKIGLGICKDEYMQEWVAKLSATILDVFGIVACIFGVIRIQKLKHEARIRNVQTPTSSFDLDVVLLHFGAFFSIIYSVLVIITGALGDGKYIPFGNGCLHIVMGIFEIIQVLIQIPYLKDFKQKLLTLEFGGTMPGRQFAMFIFLLNISKWIILTFERQTLDASLTEMYFYGGAWIVIERITIPLSIFFRFHSAIITLELWEEVYKKNNNVFSRFET